MWISKQTIIEYTQEHSINLGLILYSLGLEGGWVIRSVYGSSEYRFIMGDYIDVDWGFFTGKIIDGGFFRLIKKFDQLFGNNFIIYGIEDKVYICIDSTKDGGIYDKMRRIFSREGSNAVEMVKYDTKYYYKYPIEDIDGFGDALDLLGV